MPPIQAKSWRLISQSGKRKKSLGPETETTYYHIHCRRGISRRVYQNPVISVRPGVTAASKSPMRNLRATAKDQLLPDNHATTAQLTCARVRLCLGHENYHHSPQEDGDGHNPLRAKSGLLATHMGTGR